MPEESGLRRSDSKEQAAKGSSEAALIRRAGQGDVEAFNRLVLRHRQSVLHFAWTMVRDWDLAEDLAQQTLLEAYRGLSGLREPPKFRAWLLTIARRRAMRHWGSLASQPPTIEFSESVIYPLTHEPSFPVADDVQERIRESLLELSSRNRQVMVLHYLDGYSCSEISNRLSIPAGTIKRILHESRNHMRTGMGIAADVPHPGGGLRRMSTEKKPGPRDMHWFINGSWSGPLMDDLLRRTICLCVNKKAKTAEQIAREVDANVGYLEQAVRPLVHEELVTMDDDGRYLTNFIALEAADWIALTDGVREVGIRAANLLQPCVPELEDTWNKTTLPDRGFAWSQGIWPTLALLVCNKGLSAPSAINPYQPMHPSGNSYWGGGCEVVGPEHQLWTVGFNIAFEEDTIKCGYFWSYGLNRKYPFFRPRERAHVLTAMANGITDATAIAVQACLSVEKVREALAGIIEAGLAERRDGVPRLTFPVFDQVDNDTLKTAVAPLASQLRDDLLDPATADLSDKLRAAGYGHLEEQFGAWRWWWMSYITGEALRELLSRGVLPNPGDPAPTSFCTIGWQPDVCLML